MRRRREKEEEKDGKLLRVQGECEGTGTRAPSIRKTERKKKTERERKTEASKRE